MANHACPWSAARRTNHPNTATAPTIPTSSPARAWTSLRRLSPPLVKAIGTQMVAQRREPPLRSFYHFEMPVSRPACLRAADPLVGFRPSRSPRRRHYLRQPAVAGLVVGTGEALLAGRELRSRGAAGAGIRQDSQIHRGEPGASGVGEGSQPIPLVERRMGDRGVARGPRGPAPPRAGLDGVIWYDRSCHREFWV